MKIVFQSLLSVLGGEAAVRIANFAAVLVIARAYGKVALAAYSLSLAVVTVVVMFSDNGLQTAAITHISPATANRNQVVGRFAVSKSILLAVAGAILAVVAAFSRQDALFLAIAFWVGVRTLLQSYSQMQMSVLKAVSLARWIGIIQFLHSALLLLGIGQALWNHWSVAALLGWMAACQLVEILLGAFVLLHHGVWPNLPRHLDFLSLVKAAAPFGIAYGLANLMVRADTIVLSTLVPLEELGTFAAVNSILLIAYVCAWLFSSVLLPQMTRLSGRPESRKAYANRWARLLLLFTAPGAVLLSFFAPAGVVLLFGRAFAAAGALGSVMLLACPLIFLNAVYTSLTIASGHRGTLVMIFAGTAALTVALDFVLGRSFGAFGISLAILLREAAMLLGLFVAASRFALPAAGLEIPVSSGGN